MRARRAIASEAEQSIAPRREWIVSLDRDTALDNAAQSLLALAI
jgi:hypothetical protein